ncbi:MAG: TldD/PmbA family protein [Chloroflexi bacterium]|nr:TldD/PmbA family protein [Chloroflexota bacterium]MDA1270829.1 TldD/PmbA family protein [Chloroflexota bacterium]
MADRVTVESLDRYRANLRSLVAGKAKTLPGLRYCDLRIEVREQKGAVAENGAGKGSSEDYTFDFGVRAIAGGRVDAPGYFGRVLGATDLDRLEDVVWSGIQQAHSRARASSRQKSQMKGRYAHLGGSLTSTGLAPVAIRQDTVPAAFTTDPRQVPLADTINMAVDGCKALQGQGGNIVYTACTASTFLLRELFLSSDGADIDQSFAQTEGFAIAIATGEHGNYELYDFTGHQRGWEVLTDGYANGPIVLPNFMDFCKRLGADTVETAAAPPLKPPDKAVTVVTNPHFNTLLVHEVVGHPSELDRALKYETGYAGRSWFLKDLQDNQLGRQIASPLVTAYSDPSMEGYGSFKYDHEGTPARRAYILRNGVLEEFLNNRQTASIMGVEPNGSARSTEAQLVPLIRMTNTIFGPGDQEPRSIIADVEDGYYIAGHRTPSIAESRENFRITAVKVYEIKNGQLGRMYRDGGITSDSRDYFMSIDAVGNDLRVNPIPNCGKGQPMQAKRMSNGGPTMRGVARLTGPG